MQERTNNTNDRHNNNNHSNNKGSDNNNKGIKHEENDNIRTRGSQYTTTNTSDNNMARGESSSITDEECSEQDDSGMMWRDFVAGNFGGIAGIIAGHPVCLFHLLSSI